MSKKNSHRTTPRLSKIPAVDKLISGALICAVAIIPLIIRFKVINFVAPKMIIDVLNTGMQSNIFTYYKYVFLIIVAVICLLGLAYKFFFSNYTVSKSYINPWLLMLVLVVLMATLGASYKSIALYGTYDRNEGAITYLCYFILFFAAANILVSSKHKKYVNIALAVFIIPNFILSVLQLTGFHFLDTNFAQKLILPSEVRSADLGGFLVSTFENPNYVSGLFGPLTAYFLALTGLAETKSKRLYAGIIMGCCFIVLLVAKSLSGLVALFVVAILMFTFIYVYRIENKQIFLMKTGIIITAVIFLFIGASKLDPAIEMEVKNILPDVKAASIYKERDISSGRFYIWEKTIHLIAEKPILGHGAATLAYYFPQNDKAKLTYLSSYDNYINKAHNWYLETCFAFGIFFIVAVVALILLHTINTWKRITKTNNSSWEIALFVFFIAYLIQWLFNDSTIGSAIVFWILWGFAVSINNNGLIEEKYRS